MLAAPFQDTQSKSPGNGIEELKTWSYKGETWVLGVLVPSLLGVSVVAAVKTRQSARASTQVQLY